MPRGSKPGERRGGRQRATPNKRTALRERILAIASATATAATHDLLLRLVNDPALAADTRLAIARRIFLDDRPTSLAERSKQRRGDSKPAGEGRETSLLRTTTTPVANVGLAALPTLDLLLRMAQDATAPLEERRKAASEAARFLLPKKPGPRKSRRGKFPPDECGFSVDPILAKELRDAKLQLACLRLSSRKLTPYAVARKEGKIHARIKEIQESLQCPCPSKYRLTYDVDGAAVPGQIVRDGERLAVLSKRRMEKKTFTAEEDLEEAIRTARYESFLVGPEMGARERVTKLREKKRIARQGGPPLSHAEEVSLRFLGLLYPPPGRTLNEEEILERYPFWVLPAEAERPPDRGAVCADLEDIEESVDVPRFVSGNPKYTPEALEDEPNELDGDGGAEGGADDVDFVAWLKGQSRYPAYMLRDTAGRRFHRRYFPLVPDLIIDLMRNYDDLVDNAQGPSIMPDEDLSEQFKIVLKQYDDSLKNAV
jgi:hypothetical protein